MSTPQSPLIDSRVPDPDIVRELGYLEQRISSATALIAKEIADRYSLPLTDYLALGILSDRDHTTAGDLAHELGLSSGATTALIDRLEAANFVTRLRDENDRRKVLLILAPGAHETFASPWADFEGPWSDFLATYSPEEIAVIRRYLLTTHELLVNLYQSFRASTHA